MFRFEVDRVSQYSAVEWQILIFFNFIFDIQE
jgi:hypothetical protein